MSRPCAPQPSPHAIRASQARTNGARNKRIKAVVPQLVADYLRGRPAIACMEDLVAEARR